MKIIEFLFMNERYEWFLLMKVLRRNRIAEMLLPPISFSDYMIARLSPFIL